MRHDTFSDWRADATTEAFDARLPDVVPGGTVGRVPDHSRTDLGPVIAGRYRLGRTIARGATAEVFEATDEVLGRRVAVKVLHANLAEDRAAVERFQEEAVAAARLVHPNVVETYDAGVDDGTAYLVMEVAGGRRLSEILAAEGALPPSRAVRIGTQVAAALEAAHQQGILHRDLEPATILVSDDDRVKVADFGLSGVSPGPGGLGPLPDEARPDDPTRSTGGAAATLAYLAPEQINGEPADPRADVYALGAVLYHVLCGQPPFTASTDVSVALQHLSEPPLPPRQVRAGIPRPLEAAVLRALEKDPADRFPSAAELQSALLSIDVGPDDATPMVVRDPTPPEGVAAVRFRQTERSWLWPTALIVVVAVTLGVVGVLFATTETAQRLFSRENPTAPAAETAPLAVRSASLFDPDPRGDGDEHNAELPFLHDGDPATTWSTHQYLGSQPFGGLKSGVGVVLSLDRAAALTALELATPSRGWSLVVYVADGPQSTLEGWGDPVATRNGIDRATVTLDLGGERGRAVLVWISDPGPANQVLIGEVGLRT